MPIFFLYIQSGGPRLENPQHGPLFSAFFMKIQWPLAKPFKFQAKLFQGYAKALINAYVPGKHMWQSSDSGSLWHALNGSCQSEWLWPIANLKSLMSWNTELLQVQNIRLKKIAFQSVQSHTSQWQLCLPFCKIWRWTCNRMARIQLNPFNNLASKIFLVQISSILRQKKMGISNLVFRTIDFRFVCNNHAIQSSLLFHLTIFLWTGDFFLKIELLLLPQ